MNNHSRTPGKAQQKVDAIYSKMLERIRLLDYPPGTRLSESELADEFGVSRTPIRRVLQRLEFEGLAERVQGSYTTVTSHDLASLMDVYEVRMVLAENMDKLSAEPLTPEGIETLRTFIKRTRALLKRKDLIELGRIHYEYQAALCECIMNEFARTLMMQAYNQIARIWLQQTPHLDWDEEIRAFLDEQEAVLGAMQAGDIRTVGLIRRNHIAMNLHRMRAVQRKGD